jgi:hypothetical protein
MNELHMTFIINLSHVKFMMQIKSYFEILKFLKILFASSLC